MRVSRSPFTVRRSPFLPSRCFPLITGTDTGTGTHTHLFPFATVATLGFMQPGLENMAVIGNELALRWADGVESYFPLDFLRKACPCALCAGEKDILGNVYRAQAKWCPESIQLKGCTIVGGYGIKPEWMDGHDSGIYSFSYLRSLDLDVA